MTVTKKTSWFGPKLRAALDRTDTSVRGLAKTWRPNDPETARRSLIRYLRNGIVPTPETRKELSEALGVERDELEQDEDEESDPVTDLMASVRALVRRELREIQREAQHEEARA